MTTTTPERKWTADDHDAAAVEGWDIFECPGSANGYWQIQKIDCPEEGERVLADDTDAWVLIRDTPSALHTKALEFIADANPQEHEAIMRWGRDDTLEG